MFFSSHPDCRRADLPAPKRRSSQVEAYFTAAIHTFLAWQKVGKAHPEPWCLGSGPELHFSPCQSSENSDHTMSKCRPSLGWLAPVAGLKLSSV
ncbi:hypothetical protein RB213_009989 [Colletotrichum asianum]